MDDHWEPGTASRPVAVPASRTSWPHAAAWPSHAPLELSAHSPAHLERGADASGAVHEERTESLDADPADAVAVERAGAAAATTVGTEVAVAAATERTAAEEEAAEEAAAEVAPALMPSSVISLCAVGDDTHLRAHLSRTRAQLHAAQLQLQRASGALATTREQLSESEAERRTLRLRAEGLHVSGGGGGEAAAATGGGGGGGGGGGRGALVELAERRLAELEEELRRKDEQLQQLQACRDAPRAPPRAPPRRVVGVHLRHPFPLPHPRPHPGPPALKPGDHPMPAPSCRRRAGAVGRRTWRCRPSWRGCSRSSAQPKP